MPAWSLGTWPRELGQRSCWAPGLGAGGSSRPCWVPCAWSAVLGWDLSFRCWAPQAWVPSRVTRRVLSAPRRGCARLSCCWPPGVAIDAWPTCQERKRPPLLGAGGPHVSKRQASLSPKCKVMSLLKRFQPHPREVWADGASTQVVEAGSWASLFGGRNSVCRTLGSRCEVGACASGHPCPQGLQQISHPRVPLSEP